MLFCSNGKRVAASRYGAEIAVLQEMHWTHDEYLAAPWDLVAEVTTLLQKRALKQRQDARMAEAKARKHGK